MSVKFGISPCKNYCEAIIYHCFQYNSFILSKSAQYLTWFWNCLGIRKLSGKVLQGSPIVRWGPEYIDEQKHEQKVLQNSMYYTEMVWFLFWEWPLTWFKNTCKVFKSMFGKIKLRVFFNKCNRLTLLGSCCSK